MYILTVKINVTWADFFVFFQSSSNIVRFCKMGKLFKWINFNMIYLFINIYLFN